MVFQKVFHFGYTSQGLSIPAYRFGGRGAEVFIMGGVHGDEIEGIIGANGLLQAFSQSFPFKFRLTLIPIFNLDGALKAQRCNARCVDLNRNLPTRDWSPKTVKKKYNPGPFAGSEPENQALVNFIEKQKPRFIITLHSWKPLLNTNGDCHCVARRIAAHTNYRVTDDIGYPTPGSLGGYCGLERKIPTLTYEFERGLKAQSILEKHIPAILEGLKVLEI